MDKPQLIIFGLLIVWIVLGLLMIKGNDKCCPRNQRDYDDIDVKMVSKSSVFLPPDAVAKSVKGHRTCSDYYNLNVERCKDSLTGTYCLDKHEWNYKDETTNTSMYCHDHNTIFFQDWPLDIDPEKYTLEKAEKNTDLGFDDGRLLQTKLSDHQMYGAKLEFCGQVHIRTGETGYQACCLCGGGQLHTQTRQDMNHDEACGICGGGDTIGCKVEEHKCGYNADVARPAFAAIGLLITVGVVCTAFNNQTINDDKDETTPMLPPPTHPQASNPASQPVTTVKKFFIGSKVQLKANIMKTVKGHYDSFDYETTFDAQLKSGQQGTVCGFEASQICIQFDTYKAWFNLSEQGVIELV